jgi:uncharacterized protein YeaO (DUF488 family)
LTWRAGNPDARRVARNTVTSESIDLSTSYKHPAHAANNMPGRLSAGRSPARNLHDFRTAGAPLGKLDVRIKHIHEPREASDGHRVLATRNWPAGVRKRKAEAWLTDLAPSTQLQQWFGQDPKRWPEFQSRYRAELARRQRLLNSLRRSAAQQPLTLLHAARDHHPFNEVTVLKQAICAKV